MTLRSLQFDDIYFSPENGLEETRHVFLAGNGLPEAWAGRERFVIAETGFGTGLNFLAVWALFEKTAKPGQRLHFISFEKYPLAWDECAQALEPWRTEFGARLDRLRALYPLRVPGFHRLMLNEQVTLTLIFDDVNEALPQLEAPGGIDAWFLDGFAPAKNPQMWTDAVFAQMARLSRDGTTAATFTVAGVVRRGLAAAGFAVEKKQGFGRKREMLTARFAGKTRAAAPSVKRVAIVGGGLAGTAAAFVLKHRGLAPVLFEKNAALASGASGNPEGLYNPRLSAQRTPESDFHTAAWAQGVRTFADLQQRAEIGFSPCGSLHLATDADKENKLRAAFENWGWHYTHMRCLDADAASQQAGLTLHHPALWLPDAGTVSPAKLCRAWAKGIDVRLNAPVTSYERGGLGWRVNGEEYDAVILACATAVTSFAGLEDFPIHAVRGQMTEIRATAFTSSLKANLCFGGYLSPQQGGVHRLGATFQQWLDDKNVRPEDDADNIARLAAVLPEVGTPEVTGSRVGFRASSRDRFPVIGPAPDQENLYLSTAHGSHGIISGLAAAHIIADMITGEPRSLAANTVAALDSRRFHRRAEQKKEKRRG